MVIKRWPLALSSLLWLGGCLKLIDVDVPSDVGELVVEGYYIDTDSAVVRISRTVPYFTEAPSQGVSSALVVLEEVETGARDTLRWRDSFYVRTQGSVRPVVGHTYRLRVRVDGEEVYALSRMPRHVRFDTLFWMERPAAGPLPAGPRVIGAARDPGGEPNAYRARVWRNDTLQNRLFDWIYSDDRFIEGNFVVFEFPFQAKLGDTFAVEIMTLPPEVVRFYDQLVRNAFGGSGGFTPPPDNAYSNFTGGRRRVWGFFMAYASDRRGLRIQ